MNPLNLRLYRGADNRIAIHITSTDGVDFSNGKLVSAIKRNYRSPVVAFFDIEFNRDLSILTLALSAAESMKLEEKNEDCIDYVYDVLYIEDEKTELICYGTLHVHQGVTYEDA